MYWLIHIMQYLWKFFKFFSNIPDTIPTDMTRFPVHLKKFKESFCHIYHWFVFSEEIFVCLNNPFLLLLNRKMDFWFSGRKIFIILLLVPIIWVLLPSVLLCKINWISWYLSLRIPCPKYDIFRIFTIRIT